MKTILCGQARSQKRQRFKLVDNLYNMYPQFQKGVRHLNSIVDASEGRYVLGTDSLEGKKR